MPFVTVATGRVPVIVGFGKVAAGLEATECSLFKTLKADTFVICSNLNMAWQII